MSRLTSEYPERVYPSAEEGKMQRMMKMGGAGKISTGWMIAGLAGLGLAAWMAWHFGPDFRRYMKMERM